MTVKMAKELGSGNLKGTTRERFGEMVKMAIEALDKDPKPNAVAGFVFTKMPPIEHRRIMERYAESIGHAWRWDKTSAQQPVFCILRKVKGH